MGVLVGPLNVGLVDIGKIIIGSDDVSQVKSGVVLNIRLPRMLLGFFVGASLGVSGATMQGFFRNPLADPALIGVSSGGALAAVAVIVLGGAALSGFTGLLGAFAMPIAAFVGSLTIVTAIYRVSMQDGRVIVATMLLAGVAANSLAVSGIGYLTFLADDTQLRDLTFWTLGSLGGATWARALPAIMLMIVGVIGLLRLARPLNSLLFGEGDAAALGTNVEATKAQAAFFTALSVGAATAVCGVISFVGLVVPHLVRLVTGPDHRFVLPGSALLGGALVLGADLIARMAVTPAELPLGVVTAALGAPFFFWLLLRDKQRGGFG
ncbi:MAG: iron ABC transporter permease [Parvularculaceae bacterium]|nr:iron ABC transporter permease [Parvularculaceae bacterium]